ncbi:MAG: hypothetical protein K940chlam8_00304 [Chlamydiae bacterium]|nr:hypothetical protein [Chlamydiota bacterium]
MKIEDVTTQITDRIQENFRMDFLEMQRWQVEKEKHLQEEKIQELFFRYV